MFLPLETNEDWLRRDVFRAWSLLAAAARKLAKLLRAQLDSENLRVLEGKWGIIREYGKAIVRVFMFPRSCHSLYYVYYYFLSMARQTICNIAPKVGDTLSSRHVSSRDVNACSWDVRGDLTIYRRSADSYI